MKKFLSIIFILISSTSFANSPNFKKAYFAGGCFWCMEESFENILGVSKVISGYSGGTTENPTYKEVTYGNTGHFEVIEVIYIPEVVSYEKLLEEFWVNIDPFDAVGQFCDKGYSYRSVAFYQNDKQKNLIENSIKEIEKNLKKK
jgi:methionine-S-sulfoxide reductase